MSLSTQINLQYYSIVLQESRADAGVSARQSRHLAINYELGFSNSD